MPEVITNNLDLWTSALLTRSTAGRGTNGRLEAYGIKKLRGLILELAVRGKLVPQDPRDEPASVLLKKVASEKARRINVGMIKKSESLPVIADKQKVFVLPEGWELVRFGTIAQHNSGKTLDSGRNVGQPRDYITTSNLYWGRLDLDNMRQMPISDEELERCTAKKGDLLICEGGEAGRAAVWPYDHDVCFQNHIHRARFYKEINPYYIYRFFEGLNASGEIGLHRKGVGISNMSCKSLSLIILPIPPLPEQHRIVAKVDELMALCDQLEQRQTDNIEAHETLVETLLGTLTNIPVRPEPVEGRASTSSARTDFDENWTRISGHFDTLFTTEQSIDRLKQTILQLAVMGKLVSQDPGDEPACVLLEKIGIDKKRLLDEGKMKKQKPLSLINEEEKLFILPMGWRWCRLQEIVYLLGDGLHGTPEYTTAGKYYFINGNNLGNGEIVIKPETKTVAQDQYDKYKKNLGKNTVLVSINGTLGSVAFYDNEEIILGKSACYFNLSESIDKNFIKIVIDSPSFTEYAQKNATGTTIKNLGLSAMNSLPIALPPMEEQLRIIGKVDELMALCDALKARLSDVQTTRIHLADVIVEQAVA